METEDCFKIPPQCAVKTFNGKNCPELGTKPTGILKPNGAEEYMCEKCFISFNISTFNGQQQ